ncbi:MAG: aspartyl-tRNA(Asn)/glutamyl-tRNA(Gln) amidotransferase subunit [Campylobacterota bacterium]|nr:aspartyl-tRNA(Asn)/glutamyl-tRNA(Gln) amidotransferase subunit [Campylobacterota bacterium]
MKLDETLLERLEKLSNLTISQDKRSKVVSQLSDIVGFVENLNELDTSNTKATFSTVEEGASLREDLPLDSTLVNQDILKHAPKAKDNFFIVPKIIE